MDKGVGELKDKDQQHLWYFSNIFFFFFLTTFMVFPFQIAQKSKCVMFLKVTKIAFFPKKNH